MVRVARTLLVFVLAVVAFGGIVRSADQVLIPAGSTWKYNDKGANLGTGWRATAYNDATWLTGAAPLGYGDGDEATVLSYGGNSSNRYVTYYFRKSFTVSQPSSISALNVRFIRDDGAVLYLNGVEIARSNMPTGTIQSSTLATTAIGNADESAWQTASVSPNLLVAGTNVLAVEIHQQSVSSTDISFDLELIATDAQPAAPAVTLLTPANGDTANVGAVAFAASASAPAGLASASLVLGGSPQTAVFSGPSQIEDAQISAETPTATGGSATSLNVDGQAPHAHALMKFPSLIGAASGQVPAGSVITSATLQVNCTNTGSTMGVYRVTESWDEAQVTWNARRSGVAWTSPGADGAGSNAQVALAGTCTATGTRQISLTRFVQEWSDGAPNHGVVFTDSGTDGIDFGSSESGTSPVLTVVYQAGQSVLATQSLSGDTATIEFSATLPVGLHYWSVRVTDTLGRQSTAAASYALTVDTSAPDAPVLVTPNDTSSGVSVPPSLAALVSDPNGGPLTARFFVRRAAQPEFTIIALPDTQHYSESYPAVFTAQTQWIVANRAARNIVFVTHEGDVVEHNNLVSEWERANASMSLLDGVVPYGIGPGNHDKPTTLFNQYFPYTRYAGQPWYGGHYGSTNDNNFQLFSGGGLNFVIVHLEFCPPAAAVTWADSVLKSHPDRIGIMTTHGYLNGSAQRTVHGCTNTQYLWDGLAVPNPNLHFMLSGHVHDESRRTDVVHGHPVFQMLADYQDRASGGEGWLRILRFVPSEDTVYVHTYSPWLNRFETDANSEFTLPFAMGGEFVEVATAPAQSGSAATVQPAGLAPDTRYEWQVTVTNSSGKSRTGPIWSFTTGGNGSGQPPIANNLTGTIDEDTSAAITLGATDPEGAPLTYSVVTGPQHGTLSGSAPNVTYQPAGNYSGSDSFTFRVSDESATSNVATVSLTILPVNDAPTASSDARVVQAGSTLTVAAPGVLANDSDVDGPSLVAQLVTGPSNGTLTLAANGSFSYVPGSGFSGTDVFTYRAYDGALASLPVSVSIQVTPASTPAPIFSVGFNSGQDGFSYVDDAFRGTAQPGYANGSRVSSGGFSGGALRVQVGGVNETEIKGMSGGWRRTFTLTTPTSVALSFRYNLSQGADYEDDEFSQMLVSLNGVLLGQPPADYVAQLAGNGDSGSTIGTGWQVFQRSLGVLPAGTHTLVLGGYNSEKTTASELTTVLIDDVNVTSQ